MSAELAGGFCATSTTWEAQFPYRWAIKYNITQDKVFPTPTPQIEVSSSHLLRRKQRNNGHLLTPFSLSQGSMLTFFEWVPCVRPEEEPWSLILINFILQVGRDGSSERLCNSFPITHLVNGRVETGGRSVWSEYSGWLWTYWGNLLREKYASSMALLLSTLQTKINMPKRKRKDTTEDKGTPGSPFKASCPLSDVWTLLQQRV